MKTLTVFSTANRLQTSKGITTLLLIAFVLLFFTIPSNLFAQTPGPGVTVRFANPEFKPEDETYCVDVEFQADDVELFGLNARFFVDHSLFDFLAFDDFQGGYGLAKPDEGPELSVGDGGFFSFTGNALFINQSIEKVNTGAPAIMLSDTEWTYLFKVCFSVKDEAYLELDLFCPSIVWDLRNDPAGKGFLAGSEGMVMTAANGSHNISTQESVEHFNWEYDDTLGANMFGVPITDPERLDCVQTRAVPLPAAALALSAMLMIIFVVVRKRFV